MNARRYIELRGLGSRCAEALGSIKLNEMRLGSRRAEALGSIKLCEVKLGSRRAEVLGSIRLRVARHRSTARVAWYTAYGGARIQQARGVG
jgi:hypothetical protein